MEKLYKKYIVKLATLRSRIDFIYSLPSSTENWKINYYSSSLLFDLWHQWNDFCRSIILISCNGTITRTGILLTPRIGNNSWERIGYEVSELSRGKPLNPTKKLNYKRHEPTWGDVNLLLRAIPSLGISNTTNLLTSFGISVNGPIHLQKVRNACAHINDETMQNIYSIRSHYVVSSTKHPIDSMWWIDPTTGSDAIYSWIDDLETIIDLSTL